MTDVRAQILAEDPNVEVLWTGDLPGGDRAIIHDRDMRRNYAWPSYRAWREPIPGTVLPGQKDLFPEPKQLELFA